MDCPIIWVVIASFMVGMAAGILTMFGIAVVSGVVTSNEAKREEDKFYGR